MAPLLAIVAALGLLMVALGNTAARLEEGQAQPLFWGGLIVIYMPLTLRLFSVSASRAERLCICLLLGFALYLVKVLYSPTGFVLHDELATWRQTSDLFLSGQPLSENPIVNGYAGYPGLHAITASFSHLTGLRIFLSGMIIIAVARVLLIAALFLFFERALNSARAAGIAVAIYACNPSFLYFDSQFGYESMALVIGAAILLLALQWTRSDSPGRDWNAYGMVAAMVVLAATVAVSHHMTSYAMTAFLALWAVTIAVSPRPPSDKRHAWIDGPALPGLIVGAAAVLWFVFEASHVTTSELGHVFEDSLESVVNLITGESGSKALFQSAGQTNSTVARLLGVGSVVPLLVMIPIGLWMTWLRGTPNPLLRALAIVAAFYPVTLLLRLTSAGTETSQRASEFVFVGLAAIAALVLTKLPWHGTRIRRLGLGLGLSALATVIFLGGFIVGESPTTRQPGSFIVGGETRAITPQGIAAARFALEQLPAESRVLVDRPNSILVSSYGHLNRVSGSIEGIPVVRVFFSKTFDAVDQRIISEDAIDYIIVDRRLSHEVPSGGFYFERTERRADTYKEPIEAAMLRKFNHVAGLSRIFDNGAIAIYDTAGLRSQ
ncbi:MAG TPA: hypothetical protein VFT79_11320 [Solirubrobacterales bacterium]|nr:hypothetical protein [Solirubrobacterales bacterium]